MLRPMTPPTTRHRATPKIHGQPWFVMLTAMIAPDVPAVKPADRSISPSSRTNTRPIDKTMTAAPWLIRLAKLSAVGNVSGRRTENTIHKTISPSTAGRDPTSPPRTLAK